MNFALLLSLFCFSAPASVLSSATESSYEKTRGAACGNWSSLIALPDDDERFKLAIPLNILLLTAGVTGSTNLLADEMMLIFEFFSLDSGL